MDDMTWDMQRRRDSEKYRTGWSSVTEEVVECGGFDWAKEDEGERALSAEKGPVVTIIEEKVTMYVLHRGE